MTEIAPESRSPILSNARALSPTPCCLSQEDHKTLAKSYRHSQLLFADYNYFFYFAMVLLISRQHYFLIITHGAEVIVSCLPVFHNSHCFMAGVYMELSLHDLGSCIHS